ncbi:hypothetical protein Tco_1551412 [Tanacetum coccineum]
MSYDLFYSSSKDEDKVNSELAFFTEACSAAIEVFKLKRTRSQVEKDRYGAHDRLVAAYFSAHPRYDEATFRTWLRMSRRLFTRIVQEITDHYPYFQVRSDCSGRIGIFAFVKSTSAIRQMAYGTVPNALDECLQMGETTACDNLVNFCNVVMELYGHNINCTDWPWENFPDAFKAQYYRGDHPSKSFHFIVSDCLPRLMDLACVLWWLCVETRRGVE